MKFQDKLPQFFAAFLEAALWFPLGDDGAQLDTKFTPDDIDDDTKATFLAHCHSFLSRAFPWIEAEGHDKWTIAGHDFWLTSQQTGAGFLDGGWPKYGDILTALAHHYPFGIILEPNDEGKLVA